MLRRLGAVSPSILPYLTIALIILSFLPDLDDFAPTPHLDGSYTPTLEQSPISITSCLILTSSYCIKASLIAEELHLQLIDFKNFLLYSRVYTNSDIGKDINRRIGLAEVASVLRFSKETVKLEHDFGTTVVSSGGEDLLLVEMHGIINVYTVVITISGKEIVRSKLHLFKIRKMKEIEIFQARLEIHNKSIHSFYQPRLLQLEKSNKNLNDRIRQLESRCQVFSDRDHSSTSPQSNIKTSQKSFVKISKQPFIDRRKLNQNKFHINI